LIEVSRESAQEFAVIIKKGDPKKQNLVTFDNGYYQNLSAERVIQKELIKPGNQREY